MKVSRHIPYVPLPSQARFHESKARFKGYSGPIGSGKSQALCNEAIKLAYLNAGRTGLIGAPTFPMLSELGGGSEWIELSVKYAPPVKPSVRAAAPPVVSLSPGIQSGAGTLTGGQTLYYAVSSVDGQGVESGLSYTAQAGLPGGTDAYAVTLEGIRCAKSSAAMRVYRGRTPGLLRQIAEVTPVANLFLDAGLPEGSQPPPDANFDHARFQWRMELMPETPADQYGAAMIGRTEFGMQPDEYAGAVVRILRGRGEGQERVVRSITTDQLVVADPWVIAPDATSSFAIAEAGWKAAGITATDEIRMMVPNRPQEVVQVLGVAVSAAGAESASQEAIVGRHEILGSSMSGDADVPGMPTFGLSASGQGSLEIGGIGFETLENTNTIRTGTLTVHYWDEMKSPNPHMLGAVIDDVGQQLSMAAAYPAAVGDLLQIEAS